MRNLLQWLLAFLFFSYTNTCLGQDGLPDTSFGIGGIVTTVVNMHDDAATDLVIQEDGKIIAAGVSTDGNYYEHADFSLVRYYETGIVDSAFGTNGRIVTDIHNGSHDLVSCMALQSDEKIVVGGTAIDATHHLILARYTQSGILDSTFNDDGIVDIVFPSASACGINSLVIQPDDKIVVGGYIQNTAYKFLVMRYNADGSIDNTFGDPGQGTWIAVSEGAIGRAITLQPDGKIIVAGFSYENETVPTITAVRLEEDGEPDLSFGVNGVDTLHLAVDGICTAIALQSDGKIILTGSANIYISQDIFVARCNTDGSVDITFGDSGSRILTPGEFNLASSININDDDGILVVGSAYFDSQQKIILMKFAASGETNAAFGDNGMVTTAIGTQYDAAYGSKLDDSGRIVICGTTYNGVNDLYALARYTNTSGFPVNTEYIQHASTLLLSSNPNPFSSYLDISFSLDETENVQLAIYEINGRLIRALVDGIRPAGTYKINWNGCTQQGNRAAPGLYILKLQTGTDQHSILVSGVE